ncbi:protein TsetseEP [Scaptodrosophila lebanonensis]|uniref:Protein TsetseEP n=1 Tax=Drosophila lebanonensis TaxID=7225 RepID=A0A6J2UGZ7_DROLE|nr:protein TsetseEP [Scaptodrosophila lebanonensis]
MKALLTTLAFSIWLTHSLSYLEEDGQKVSAAGNDTTQCFSLYQPLLKELGAQWSTDYEQCLQNASTIRVQLLTDIGALKDDIKQAAMGVSNFIEECLQLTDALEYFNCFSKFSKQNLATVYAISFNASADALILNEKLASNEISKYQCTNETERDYVVGTSQVFDALDHCLLYGPPSTATTTFLGS